MGVCACLHMCLRSSTCVCVCLHVSVSACALRRGRLAVVLDPGDGGFAEETVLVVHQVLVDAGSAETTQTHNNVKTDVVIVESCPVIVWSLTQQDIVQVRLVLTWGGHSVSTEATVSCK